MLEKNKDYIEFLMHTMMVTHRPYADDAEIGITGMIPERNYFAANNPFDIPCDVVVIPKEKFEALQTENEQLKKKLEECENDNKLKRDKSKLLEQEIKIYTKALKDWKEVTGYPSPYAAKTAIESGASWCHAYNEIKKVNEKLNDDVEYWMNATGYSTPEGFLAAMINNKTQSLYSWQKATGCQTPEEAKELRDEVKYISDELASANSQNNSWKAAAECNSPKELMEKLSLRRDDISGRSTVIEFYKRNIEEWQRATGCKKPEYAKELMDDKQRHIVALRDQLNVRTSYLQKEKEKYDQAIEMIGEWQRATGHFLPKTADDELASLKKEVSDYKEQIKSLFKVIEAWNKVTCCSTPEEAKDWVNELGEANGSLAQAVLSWQNVTGFNTPEEAKDHWVAKLSESGESNESLSREVLSWHEITGFGTPEKCSSYIEILEKKLEDIKDLIEED